MMTLKWQLGVEEKGELRRRVSSRYVTPVWSSSSGTIRRLVQFAKLTIVEMCWLMTLTLSIVIDSLNIFPYILTYFTHFIFRPNLSLFDKNFKNFGGDIYCFFGNHLIKQLLMYRDRKF